jgi:hypothetical protein
MPIEKNTVCQCLSDALVKVLHDEFGGDRYAVLLFEQFFQATTYSRRFALLLIDVARGRHSCSWEIRRLAALMLQEHLLTLDVENTSEFCFVLKELGLRAKHGSRSKMPASALKEGYSSRDVRRFVAEFRRRLGRPHRIFRWGRNGLIDCDELLAFVRCSRQECKLALGRYLFSPEEIVARIKEQVQSTAGKMIVTDDELVAREMQRTISNLPDFEASILAGLCSGTQVYWVAGGTTSRLNSLVEYPLGTVVLAVKPPGSHFEFELKRAGRRGAHPLSAVMERNGSHVAPSHRLDGGSMASALQWDMMKTSIFNTVYRYVHDEEAPISRIVHLTSKCEVPVRGGACTTMRYLTDRSVYGDGFDSMREAMTQVVSAFRRERDATFPPIPGAVGLTVQFIYLVVPAQAVICGSSSFRLDLVAKYLSADGPEEYFRRGLQIEYQALDAKRLADDVLDEVLGVYEPPDVKYQGHEHYVAAALAVPRNRARASAVYKSLLDQIGTMWGTLLGLRGYSFGESFVARNVGLRTIWSKGQWFVRLIFQDHDNLVVPDQNQAEFWPTAAVPSTALDDLYINGRDGSDNLGWELNSLRRIYRVDRAVQNSGRKRMRKALKDAYVKTQFAMMFDPRVRSRFDERFIKRLRDWDAVARIYLARHRSVNANDWKTRIQRFLQTRGYCDGSIADHCRALEEHGSFVDTYSLLFRARFPAPPIEGISRDGVARWRAQSSSP